jgi:hypothetical protein
MFKQVSAVVMDDQELNEHWREMIDSMNNGFMLISPDGKVLMVDGASDQNLDNSATYI